MSKAAQHKLARAVLGLERAEAKLAAALHRWEKARKAVRYYERVLDKMLSEPNEVPFDDELPR